VRVERAVGKSGRLHHFAHGDVFKSALPEQAGSLLHDPLMPGGGLFSGEAHFPESSIYDGHHIPSMMIVIFDGWKEEK
jgi:hypothetical protein